jgi:hypothetical protein
MNRSFYTRYPKRHQLTTFDSHIDEIEFRLSLLPSDDWLAEWARHTSGYALWLSTPIGQPGVVRARLVAPPDPIEPALWDFEESITPEIELRATLAVAEGLLGYELARPPPLRDLRTYVAADHLLASLHDRWRSEGSLQVPTPQPLHERLDPFASSLESYLTIDSIYARVDGPRPPRKRR